MYKRAVDALEPQDKPWIAWDDRLPGFGVRVYPPGSKVYVVQTRHRGKSRRVTLGRHGVLTADGARRGAALAISRIKSGQEPEEKAPGTVAELAARYLREHVEVRCKASTQRGGATRRPLRNVNFYTRAGRGNGAGISAAGLVDDMGFVASTIGWRDVRWPLRLGSVVGVPSR
ncbi:MAG: Arm DNA-binding domain-containing protein [Deltaproteobacteria bacterium]|nr:Arm DNA-binding domain-containing protein [Deltaproteobacteria bacterium]